MLGAAGKALLRACPGARRAGILPNAAAVASAAAWRCQPSVLSWHSGAVLRPALQQLGSSGLFSSMTASRPGGDADEECESGTGEGPMPGMPLPPRTVPDDILGFSCRTYMAGDSDDRYPNVHGVHPAEFKVELTRYLVHLLENILVEARNVEDDEDEVA
eukprot:g7345.t1